MKQREIGAVLDALADDVRERAHNLIRQSRLVSAPAMMRDVYVISLIKQAVDTPHRARAQLAAWMAAYNSRNGAGTAQSFLAECLAASGSSKTLAQINAALASAESQAQIIVDHVANDAWTWERVADAIETAFAPVREEDLSFARLPIPADYVTVWGEPW